MCISGALDAQLFYILVHQGLLCLAPHKAAAAQPAHNGKREVEADGELADDALTVPVWRHIGNVVRHGLGRAVQVDWVAVHAERAARRTHQAEQCLRAFGGARAHQPIQPQNFALVHTEGKVFYGFPIG